MTGVRENWKEKAVALGSDGASAMVGDMGGVYALLKRDIPHLFKAPCIAHRLGLAVSDTVKAVPQFEEDKDMSQWIWKHYHYHYSPKVVHDLKELAESMQVKAYKAVKADGTRWVPYLKRALDILLHSSNPFTAHFTSKRCNNARQSV